MRHIEHVILMSRKTDKCSIRRGASLPGLFVGPELRSQDENILETGGQHASIGSHVQVIINFILPIEVGNSARDGVRGVHEVQADISFVPLGLLFAVPTPRASLHLLRPGVLVGTNHAIMDDHYTAALLQKFFETCPLLADNVHAVLGIDDKDVRLLELGGGGKLQRAIRFESALGQECFPLCQETRVVVLVRAMTLCPGADEDAKGRGGGGGAGDEQNKKREHETDAGGQIRNPKAEGRKKSEGRRPKKTSLRLRRFSDFGFRAAIARVAPLWCLHDPFPLTPALSLKERE